MVTGGGTEGHHKSFEKLLHDASPPVCFCNNTHLCHYLYIITHICVLVNLLGKEVDVLGDWIAEVVGKMHVYKISQDELAEKMGVRREHINKILNGRIAPKGAEERITAALDAIIAGT